MGLPEKPTNVEVSFAVMALYRSHCAHVTAVGYKPHMSPQLVAIINELQRHHRQNALMVEASAKARLAKILEAKLVALQERVDTEGVKPDIIEEIETIKGQANALFDF